MLDRNGIEFHWNRYYFPHISFSTSIDQKLGFVSAKQDSICIEWKPPGIFTVFFLSSTVKNDSEIFHKLLSRRLLVTGHDSVHFDFWILTALRNISQRESKSRGKQNPNEMDPAFIYVTDYSERQAAFRNR